MKVEKHLDIFEPIPLCSYDQTENIEKQFLQDKSDNRIFLGSSELCNENNQTYQFEVVKRAEDKLNCSNMTKDYLPPEGDQEFNQLARNLCFGTKDVVRQYGKHILTIQTPGATGAIRLGFNFLKKFMNAKVYIPSPAWYLGIIIGRECELDCEEIDFFDSNTQDLKFDNLINKLKSAQNCSILFMQDIANSSTGKDPSIDQWKQIIEIVKHKDLRVFLDSAFQGFSSGDIENDCQVVKMFLEAGIQFLVAQTFSKNMGLYGERIGCLHVVVNNEDDLIRVKSQFEHRIRCLWLSPNLYGMRIVKTILSDNNLFNMWKKELSEQVNRLKECRKLLIDTLKKFEIKGNWESLADNCGFFVLLPLRENQINELRDKHKMYTMKNGRINISTINKNDVERVCLAIKEALQKEEQQ